MSTLGALLADNQIGLLAGLADAVRASPTDASATPGLALGQIVTARVVAAEGSQALVQIEGQPYTLALPEPAAPGTTLPLQVLETGSNLQFRLMNQLPDSGSTAEVSLSTPSLPEAAAQSAKSNGAPSNGAALANPDEVSTSSLAAPLLLTSSASSRAALSAAPDPSRSATTAASIAPADVLAQDFLHQADGHASALLGSTPGLPARATENAGALASPAAGSASGPLAIARGSAELASQTAAPEASAPAPLPTPLPAPLAQGSTAGKLDPASMASQLQTAMAAPSSGSSSTPIALSGAVSAWAGQAWPDQQVRIEIDRERERAPFTSEPAPGWRATLHLELPSLGGLAAEMVWNTGGVRLSVRAQDGQTATALQNASPELLSNLRSLGLRVTTLGIVHEK